jgi:putative intracellular protease/amidase
MSAGGLLILLPVILNRVRMATAITGAMIRALRPEGHEMAFNYAGVLKGKRATYYNTPESRIEMKKSGAILVDRPVVSDGLIITVNGPPASQELGEAIVHTLTTFPR